MKDLNYKKGFTLIELLLVVAIVTLLSSVFFYNSSEARKKAEDAHMAVESRQVSSAVQMYYDNNRFVPHSTEGGIMAGKTYNETSAEYTTILQPLVTEGYISEIPKSPGGDNYSYGFTEGGKKSYFIVKMNKTKNICKTIGEMNGEDSCNEILEPTDSCGLSPYITGYSEQTEENGEQLKYIYATDPEGEQVIFEFVSINQSSPNSCWINDNQLWCNMHSGTEFVNVNFTLRTENCPTVNVQTIMDNQNYNPPSW